jgi:hypothetical protein
LFVVFVPKLFSIHVEPVHGDPVDREPGRAVDHDALLAARDKLGTAE